MAQLQAPMSENSIISWRASSENRNSSNIQPFFQGFVRAAWSFTTPRERNRWPIRLYLTNSTTTQPPLVLSHFYSMAAVQSDMFLSWACTKQLNFTGVFHGHPASTLGLYTFANNILEAAPRCGTYCSSIQETTHPSVSYTQPAWTIQLK